MDGIPPLLPQHHDDGELHGKLNNLYVEHWIGENCLMSEHGPWNKIISRNESALGYGINLAFTYRNHFHHHHHRHYWIQIMTSHRLVYRLKFWLHDIRCKRFLSDAKCHKTFRIEETNLSSEKNCITSSVVFQDLPSRKTDKTSCYLRHHSYSLIYPRNIQDASSYRNRCDHIEIHHYCHY